ncbi:hypothetical protein GQ53DRAFT_251421 [Thozetella sp. PMI_491]|nr:hypothetical protein GQ53DRAFT_251421 [Thozetella sp. PMI_491]
MLVVFLRPGRGTRVAAAAAGHRAGRKAGQKPKHRVSYLAGQMRKRNAERGPPNQSPSSRTDFVSGSPSHASKIKSLRDGDPAARCGTVTTPCTRHSEEWWMIHSAADPQPTQVRKRTLFLIPRQASPSPTGWDWLEWWRSTGYSVQGVILALSLSLDQFLPPAST